MPIVTAAFLFLAATEPTVVVTGRQWAPFISPMGEPFRAKTADVDTLKLWFVGADRDHDNVLRQNEMVADAERFFARLDVDSNGRIEPDEMIDYEWSVAPDVQIGSTQRRQPGTPPPPQRKTEDRRLVTHLQESRLQGAARYALLNIPQPVAAADSDFNRSVSLAEFRNAAAYRFQLLDSGNRGGLDLQSLDVLRTKMLAEAQKKSRRRIRDDEDDNRVATPL